MGQWLVNDAQWYEQRMLFCDLCGRMIATRYLQAEVQGGIQTFCEEVCEQLYRDYWLNERGPGYRRSANVQEQYSERMVP